MNRRTALRSVLAGSLAVSAGYLGDIATRSSGDEKVELRTRLGTADGVSVATDLDESGYAYGTERAAAFAEDALSRMLRDEDVDGRRVTTSVDEISLADIDGGPQASEVRRDTEDTPWTGVYYEYDREGRLIGEPSTSFETLVEVVPRTVESTIRSSEREYTAVFPGVCRRYWQQEQ